MGRKGKIGILVCFLIVVILSLYRNLGVPVIRFWPLILVDTLLRVPGDTILKLIKPGVPPIGYEMLSGILQIGTILLGWIAFGKFRVSLRGKPQKGIPAIPQEESPQARTKRIRKKRLTVAGWIALGLLIVNGRCGRGAVSILSFSCGVNGYPLHVTTGVSVREAAREEHKKIDAHRPPMLFLFEDSDQLQREEHLTKDLWRLTSQSGAMMTARSFDSSSSSKKDLKEWRKELMESTAQSGLPASAPRGFYKGGKERSVIGANLDLFLDKAGGGWWREQAGGFVVAVKKVMPEGVPIDGPRIRFSASIFHAEGLDSACLFLKALAGVDVVNTVGEAVRPAPAGPLVEFGEELGEVHVKIDHEHSLGEIVEEVARSQICAIDDQVERFVVRDLKNEEIEARVKQLFDARRAAPWPSYPDPTIMFFPVGSAQFVQEYLDDIDDEIIIYAIEVLEVVGVDAGRVELSRMLYSGRTKSGRKLPDRIQEDVADILMKAGETAALSSLKRLKHLDREHVEFWYQNPVNVVPTLGAVEIQDELLAMFRLPNPRVRPGKLLVRSLPEKVSRADAAAVERLALDVLNAFSISYWDEDAAATLKFSPDGRTARYSLELSHYWGPLAAGGSPYDVELVKVDGRWLVTRAWWGFGWIS